MPARALRLQTLATAAPAVHSVNERRHGRLRVADVHCSLGQVQDVSPVGLRVRCRAGGMVSVGQSLTMTLGTPIGLLSVRAVVVWARRLSLRHSEVGLALVEMDEDVKRGMTAIARGCASSEAHGRGYSASS
ncbi:MAG: PilZ domain-containing protein [Phycisphaerales bacterium]